MKFVNGCQNIDQRLFCHVCCGLCYIVSYRFYLGFRYKQLDIMSEFGTFEGQLKNGVKKLAQKISSIYSTSCTQENANCQTKSYNECQGIDNRQCIEYPQRQGCPWKGASVSKSGGIRFPLTVDRTSLSNTQKLFICNSYSADQVLKQIKVKFNTQINRVYFGTYFGYFRAYPATQQDLTINNTICINSFETRIRPWYVGAVTGIRNIVIIINNSMAERNLAQAKRMAKTIIDTLGQDDFIAIATYPVQVAVMGQNVVMAQAKKLSKTTLKTNIDSLTIQNGLNSYQQAFNKVKQILTFQKTQSVCSPPNNIVFFFTDSVPNSGSTTSADITSKINAWNNDPSFNIKLFPYAVGPNTNKTLLKQIACNFYGQLFTLAETSTSSDLISILPKYYSYLSATSPPDQPIWSDPFTDASTGDRIVGLSMPIFYNQNGETQVLGAANIAVRVPTLTQQYGFSSEQDIINRLVNYRCISGTITESAAEVFRVNKCSSSASSATLSSCQYTVFSDPIGDPPLKGEKQRFECCTFTTGGFIGLILGLFFGIVLIITLTCLYCRWRNRNKRRQLEKDNLSKIIQGAQGSATGINPQTSSIPPKIKSMPTQFLKQQNKTARINYPVSNLDCARST